MTPLQQNDIDTRFKYHAPFRDKAIRHSSVRDACKSAAAAVIELTPPGREQALALTKLEEAMMWANAAIARSPVAINQPLPAMSA